MLESAITSDIVEIPHTEPRLVVTRCGHVLNPLDGPLEPINQHFYEINIFGAKHLVRIELILLMAFKPIYNSKDFILNWSFVEAGPEENLKRPNSLIWSPPEGGQVDPDNPGFFVCPIYGFFSINDAGVIVDRRTMEIKEPKEDRSGYKALAFKSYEGKSENMGVHRIQCLSRYWYDSRVFSWTCNHGDGNKADNSKGNVKFSPQGSNNKHALRSGFRDVYKPVDMLDILIGTKWNFPTLTDAADFLNINTGHLRTLLRDKPLYPHFGRFAFKYSDAPFGWPVYNLDQVRRNDKDHRDSLLKKAVIVIDIRSSEAVIYSDMGSAGRAIGFTLDDMKTAFRIGSENFGQPRLWPYKGYEFRWLAKNKIRHFRKYTKEEIEAFKDQVNISNPLRVTYKEGGVAVFPNHYAFSLRHRSPSRPVLRKDLEKNGGFFQYSDFTVEEINY